MSTPKNRSRLPRSPPRPTCTSRRNQPPSTAARSALPLPAEAMRENDRLRLDLLKATFPGGSISGAPKVRAMEIIDELEPTRRGPYAGAVGYFSFSGNMDTCITIRSVLVKEGKAYVQAGAGIVADSQPEKEYEEILNKAQAIFKSIKLAESSP